MKLAMIGLGKMGMAMTKRLLSHHHEVVAFDLNQDTLELAREAGATSVESLADAVQRLDDRPRLVWLMLPAGEPVTLTLQELARLVDEGDIVIEGGNSNYKQSMERGVLLRYKGIHFLDVGVSGGIKGLEHGFNLMVGGDQEAFSKAEPIFKALAPENGYRHVGPSGAGHFVKMVHNGIEYGMMQALAEGFEIMAAKPEFDLNLTDLADLWMHGSVIRSWLLELTGNVLNEDPALDWVEPHVQDSGEGRWTVMESIDLAVPAPVITLALQMRFRSRQPESFSARLLAALRSQFGGHAVRRPER